MLTLSGSPEGQLKDRTRPIIASAIDIAEAHTIPTHSHYRSQLLYAVSGVMQVAVGSKCWSITPHHGIWIPTGIHHEVRAQDQVAYRSLYIDPLAAQELSSNPIPVEITPLVRELIAEAVSFGTGYNDKTPEWRLNSVLLDQLSQLKTSELPVPLPVDPRLRCICDRMIQAPEDNTTLEEWENICGASYRTLARLFRRETGHSFTAWRERVRLSFAIERLRGGESVTVIALDLGYANSSAFSAMFRRVLGVSPSRYLSTRS